MQQALPGATLTDAGASRLVATLPELLKAIRLVKQSPAPYSASTPTSRLEAAQ